MKEKKDTKTTEKAQKTQRQGFDSLQPSVELCEISVELCEISVELRVTLMELCERKKDTKNTEKHKRHKGGVAYNPLLYSLKSLCNSVQLCEISVKLRVTLIELRERKKGHKKHREDSKDAKKAFDTLQSDQELNSIDVTI